MVQPWRLIMNVVFGESSFEAVVADERMPCVVALTVKTEVELAHLFFYTDSS
jgi:hypothetical protein